MDVRNSSGEMVSLLNKSDTRHHPYSPRQSQPYAHSHSHSHSHAHPQRPQLHLQRPRHASSHSPASSISSPRSASGSGSGSVSSSFAFPSACTSASATTSPALLSTASPSLALPPLSFDLSLHASRAQPAAAASAAPAAAASSPPRNGRTISNTPSLTRTDSSDTCTTHSPSPIITPANAFEAFAFRPITLDGLHPAHASSQSFHKLPSVRDHPLIVAPPSPTSSSPQSFHHRRLPLRPSYNYGSSHVAASSGPMDPFTHIAQTTPSALQVSLPPTDMHFAGVAPQPYFANAALQSPGFDTEALQSSNSTPKAKPSTKKNSYPCPVAKQYGCNEFFTTSGHAARHAKKHTGKKDAICPECSKAFTRKDNMEQHRRTHTGVRAAPKAPSSSDESRTKRLKIEKQKKEQEANLATAVAAANNPAVNIAPVAPMEMGMLDPRLMDNAAAFNPTDTVGILPTSFQQPLPSLSGIGRPSLHRSSYTDALQIKPLGATSSSGATPTSASNTPELSSPSIAPALDALALAASRQ